MPILYTVGRNLLVDVGDLSVVSVPVAIGIDPVLSSIVRVWSLLKPPENGIKGKQTNKQNKQNTKNVNLMVNMSLFSMHSKTEPTQRHTVKKQQAA